MEDGTNGTRSRPTGSPERTIRSSRLLYAVGVWLGLAVLAMLNAVVRESLIAPAVGDYWGHVTSTATYLSGLSVVSYLYFGRYQDHSFGELVAIGIMWPAMTVAFEFGFGHYVAGNTWDALLADYDLLSGRVWSLVPLSMAIVPLLFGHYLNNGVDESSSR